MLGLMLSLAAFSQKAVIKFDEKQYDFEKINEADGKVSHVFIFTNTGASPLVISKVRASCGCTTPTWTKEPIEPGKKGSITVTYNPAGRPSFFTKTITVSSNATEEQTTLVIKGEVIPKVQSNNPSLPVVMGDLRLKSKVVQMNNVDKGKIQTRYIDIQNEGKSEMRVSLENLPAFVTATVTPQVLKAGETGKITFTFNAKAYSQWGPVSEDVFVVLNNKRKYSPEFSMKVVANVVEDFGQMTLDQKRNAPILETPGRSIDLGVIKKSSKKVAKFRISNKGIDPLEVRRIINNNREINVHQSNMTVKGGKSANVIIDVSSKTLPAGDYKKAITIQTNDPDNSFILVTLNWKVQ